MVLRSSISTTKKFLQKTLKSFKSFLSQDYQRLPKIPPFKFNPFSFQTPTKDMNLSQSSKELDMFYAEFTRQFDRDKQKGKKRRSKKKIISSRVKSNIEDDVYEKSGLEKNVTEVERGEEFEEKKRQIVWEGEIRGKLKELEMMDKGNIEHVLDVEEVLHYYSRLNSSAYIGIFDKFFMGIYAEISSMACTG